MELNSTWLVGLWYDDQLAWTVGHCAMTWHFAFLWSDYAFWLLVFLAAVMAVWIRRKPHWRQPWQAVARSKVAMITAVILMAYGLVTALDCIHIDQQGHVPSHRSLLDLAFGQLAWQTEVSYSAPFATQLLSPRLKQDAQGKVRRVYPALTVVGSQWSWLASVKIALLSLCGLALVMVVWMLCLMRSYRCRYWAMYKRLRKGDTCIAWREAMVTVALLWALITAVVILAHHAHVLGTDKIGRDVLYLTVKSIRTGVLIGTLTTLFMLPFALALGLLSGYFRGWVDDVIQYVYTTLSAIPGVLLITAAVLVLQVTIANHPHWFSSMADRADARLLALCIILGVTSWTSLCRLLRGETLKLRQLEYVQAAKVMQSTSMAILRRHILPNVMHIVLITLVLDFSGLVLAEAILSYVGVGVDPTTISWGHMINSSRLELAREPMVWWPLVSSMVAMFVLVLSANVFADRVRDAFDPRNQ